MVEWEVEELTSLSDLINSTSTCGTAPAANQLETWRKTKTYIFIGLRSLSFSYIYLFSDFIHPKAVYCGIRWV